MSAAVIMLIGGMSAPHSTFRAPRSEPAGSPPLTGERVAFTGTLASMTHRDARQRVEALGGTATEHVSRQTTILVVGEEGWPLEPDGEPSQKLQQVVGWNEERVTGIRSKSRNVVDSLRESEPPAERADYIAVEPAEPIRILTESQWLYLCGLDERRDAACRQYSPAMLSRMLDVSVGTIRRWERLRLIRPVRKVHRLPYFDFREVSGVRRLAQLLEEGIPQRKLEASLLELQRVLGDERPLVQLEILARDARIVYRDDAGLVDARSRQRLFDFEDPESEARGQESEISGRTEATDQSSPVEDVGGFPESFIPHPTSGSSRSSFNEACRLLDDGEVQAAIEAFRQCLQQRPGHAELNFHLADALYRAGRTHAAIERYCAALESDPEYLEAWTQLGCLHLEVDDPEGALAALYKALVLHPDCAEAHLHAGEALCRLGRPDDAVAHWRAYLRQDDRGPWADQVRQKLAEVRGSEVTG